MPAFRSSASAPCGPVRWCNFDRESALLEQNQYVDGELFGVGRDRIGLILLDEQVLGLEPFFVEIIGDRLVGVVQLVVGAVMDEFQGMALGRLADRNIAARR